MEIFELVGKILIKDDGAEKKLDDIDKKASHMGLNLSGAFSKIGGAALKFGSIIGAGMGIEKMISKAAAGQEKMAQLEAVLKSTGGAAGITKDEITKLCDEQGKLTTFSKGANIETSSLLLTFTSIGKDVFPQALKTVNDMSQALGQDTKSSAIQLGKALQDPITGITALRRVGVNFNETQVDTIKNLVDSGKAMDAQKLILKELGKEFGGSAEAAGKTFNGQMIILKNQISGIGSAIGGVLIPYMTDFVNMINDAMPSIKEVVTDTIEVIVPKFKKWGGLIKDIAEQLLPSLGDSSLTVKDKVKDLTGPLDIVTGVLQLLRDNIWLVKSAAIGLTGVWIAQKGVLFALYTNKLLNFAVDSLVALQTGASTGNVVANTAAKGLNSVATGIATGVNFLFGTTLAFTGTQLLIVAGAIAVVVGLVLLLTKGFESATSEIKSTMSTASNLKDIKLPNLSTSMQNFRIPGHAAGGNILEDHWATVNERGGEIQRLKSGTLVIPNDISEKLAAAGGGGSTENYYINLNVNADEISEVQDLVNMINKVKQTARTRVAVTI